MKKFSERLAQVLALVISVSWFGTSASAHTRSGSERLTREIRHELLMLPYYGVFDHLEFGINKGSIELRGAVTRPTLKSDAANVVKTVEGVAEVKDNIEVLPLSTMDDQIRLAAFQAIYGDSALSTRYGYRAQPPIHIIVRNGHVTLEGVVANEFDRNLAGLRANGVRNVFSVTNHLRTDTHNN